MSLGSSPSRNLVRPRLDQPGSYGYRARRHPEVRGQKPVNQIQSKPNSFFCADFRARRDQGKGAFSGFCLQTTDLRFIRQLKILSASSCARLIQNCSMVPVQDMQPALPAGKKSRKHPNFYCQFQANRPLPSDLFSCACLKLPFMPTILSLPYLRHV